MDVPLSRETVAATTREMDKRPTLVMPVVREIVVFMVSDGHVAVGEESL